jgi:hypothetical protein
MTKPEHPDRIVLHIAGDMTFEVEFARLEAPGCQAEVGGNRT